MEFWRLMNFNKIILIVSLFVFHLSAQDCKSELSITSDFDMVNIFINDSLVSTNGNFNTELKIGVYVIIADEVSDRWNSKTFIDTLQIDDCTKRELKFFFRTGNNSIEVDQNSNDFNFQKKYFLSDSAYKNFDLTIPSFKKEKFIESTLFKVLTGSAVLLGGVTAYYKIKADKYFDEYLSTRDKSKLDKTKKYDLISGVTLTAFQINFGYILIRFLLE